MTLPAKVDARPGDIAYVTHVAKPTPPAVSAGIFWPAKNTLAEVIAAARAIERLGYQPELRFAANSDDPEAIEIIVNDVPTLLRKLQASLTPTNHIGGPQG